LKADKLTKFFVLLLTIYGKFANPTASIAEQCYTADGLPDGSEKPAGLTQEGRGLVTDSGN